MEQQLDKYFFIQPHHCVNCWTSFKNLRMVVSSGQGSNPSKLARREVCRRDARNESRLFGCMVWQIAERVHGRDDAHHLLQNYNRTHSLHFHPASVGVRDWSCLPRMVMLATMERRKKRTGGLVPADWFEYLCGERGKWTVWLWFVPRRCMYFPH